MAEEKKKQETTDERVGKDERYMEGNYDNRGNIVKRYKQKRDDEYRSVQIAEEIKASQEAVYERETERLSYEEKAEGDAFVQLMRDYIEEDKYQQYLVDGAVLRCNQATTDDFDYAGGTVVLENRADEVCDIILDVHENPIYEDPESMMINNKIYATVKDTIQGLNINPPKCNCRLAVNRIAENKKIKDDEERNRNGVCKHLMLLNDTWDNYRVEGTEYLKRDNAIMVLDNGEDGQLVQVGTSIEDEAIEGITMTSVLFCKHGGLIMPVTSGQDELRSDSLESRIQELVAGVEGKPIDSQDEMFVLSTMEILSRLIYQENKTGRGECAVMFSVINRLFSNAIFKTGTSTNNLYSIVTGNKQYSSVCYNDKKYPNAYHPQISEDSYGENDAWENSKRLAAILYISIEDFGVENNKSSEGERDENKVMKGDEDTYKQVIDFVEQQTDTYGDIIKNEIGERESFASTEYYNKYLNKKDPLEIEGNTFFLE